MSDALLYIRGCSWVNVDCGSFAVKKQKKKLGDPLSGAMFNIMEIRKKIDHSKI